MDTAKKHKSHAFGKDIYFLGQDSDGQNYWLEEPSWDCDWYWSVGYVETYTNNDHPDAARDIDSHQHFDGLMGRLHLIKDLGWTTPLTDREQWTLSELMRTAYTLKETAALHHVGGAHVSANPCKDMLKDPDRENYINATLLPAIFEQVKTLLSPSD